MRIDTSQEYLLGNPSLHLQLSAALAVMAQLICNPNKPPGIAQLAETLDVSVGDVRKLLRLLAAGELVKPHPQDADTWVCSRPAHAISLADIYQCLLADSEESKIEPGARGAPSGADILMMQATMSVNQLVLQHLERFDLGRLKVAESAQMFTAALREKAGRIQFEPQEGLLTENAYSAAA